MMMAISTSSFTTPRNAKGGRSQKWLISGGACMAIFAYVAFLCLVITILTPVALIQGIFLPWAEISQ